MVIVTATKTTITMITITITNKVQELPLKALV